MQIYQYTAKTFKSCWKSHMLISHDQRIFTSYTNHFSHNPETFNQSCINLSCDRLPLPSQSCICVTCTQLSICSTHLTRDFLSDIEVFMLLFLPTRIFVENVEFQYFYSKILNFSFVQLIIVYTFHHFNTECFYLTYTTLEFAYHQQLG